MALARFMSSIFIFIYIQNWWYGTYRAGKKHLVLIIVARWNLDFLPFFLIFIANFYLKEIEVDRTSFETLIPNHTLALEVGAAC